jgi:hypothetical protein
LAYWLPSHDGFAMIVEETFSQWFGEDIRDLLVSCNGVKAK